ncbi:MAG: hypothetical protein KGJ86_14230, partial [Chloroflexota bacterium]|nr:hypothetical protein [Chloroflexota bacterium]
PLYVDRPHSDYSVAKVLVATLGVERVGRNIPETNDSITYDEDRIEAIGGVVTLRLTAPVA